MEAKDSLTTEAVGAPSPVDVVKTRFMNAPRGRYRGVLDCARQTATKEGAGAFYR